MENFDKFYETFGIEKEEILTPGRDWDDEGLASWYVDTVYPFPTAGQCFDLIEVYNLFTGKLYSFKKALNLTDVSLDIEDKLLNLYNKTLKKDKETAKEIKEEIQDVFSSQFK